MVSWAHANTDWDQNQTAQWEHAVKEFAQLLRTCGIDADLDLWHLSETSIDWTRWGPDKVRTREFVIVVVSEAWKQRWQGTNAPTTLTSCASGAHALAPAPIVWHR